MTQLPELIDFLDIEALTDEQIELSPAQIKQAARQSQAVTDQSQQLQLYIHALALLGFKEWLAEWASELEINESRCSLFQRDRFVSVCHFSVAKFDLCLIANPVLLESTVSFPKAVVDLHQFAPHIYVLIEVYEEQMQIKVRGYLRQDQLSKQRRLHPLKSISNDRYSVPLDWFNPDPTALLLELRCLTPYPVLLQQPPQAINVGHWLSDRLDDAAQQFGWLLLPPLAPAALRSAQEELLLLGVRIPPEARGVYYKLQLGAATLRLQAMTWVLSTAIDAFEWTLLIVLSGDRLPIGTHLRIRDQHHSLCQQVSETAENSSLFAQVGGNLADQFWVSIDLPDGAAIELPPFCFSVSE
jgi:Protein of unknown function (DUF1822)